MTLAQIADPTRAVVYLASNYRSAVNFDRELALGELPPDAPASLATSFREWIEKLWELEGDGRRIADALDLAVTAEATVEHHSFSALSRTPGLSTAIRTCASRALGTVAFDGALRRAQEGDPTLEGILSAPEIEFLVLVGEFVDALDAQGFVTFGGILSSIAANEEVFFPEPLQVALVDSSVLTLQQRDLFDRCERLTLLENPVPDDPFRSLDELQIRCAFSAGSNIAPQVVLDAIAGAMDDGCGSSIVVSCKDPFVLFEAIAPALDEAEISYGVSASVPLAHTAFGQAFQCALALVAEDADLDPFALTDLAHSMLVSQPKPGIWSADGRVRGDRLIDLQKALETFASFDSVNEMRQAFLALAAGEDPGHEPFEQCFQAMYGQGYDTAQVELQRRAHGALVAALHALQGRVKDVPAALGRLVSQMSLPIHWSSASASSRPGFVPRVRIMDQGRAAMLGPDDAETLILYDLTDEAYPLQEPHSPVHTLIASLCGEQDEDTFERARQRFASLLAVPSKRVVLGRSLNDMKGDPYYPAVMFQELSARLWEKVGRTPQTPDEHLYGLPEEYLAHRYERGEEDLHGDLAPSLDHGQHEVAAYPAPQRGNLDGAQREWELLTGLDASSYPRLSPSQIENYLDCPYKWFIASRMGADSPDEGFGPMQIGSFMHEVFCTFYGRFGKKVSRENLEEARKLMFGTDEQEGIFDKVRAAQYELDENGHPKNSRLVPLPGTTEVDRMEMLRRSVDDWLVTECDLLPGFTPVAFECAIDGVQIAGCRLKGIVDRIDVDAQGNAIIIDYKGTLRGEHELVNKEGYNERAKVQTLLYAQVVQDAGAIAVTEAADEAASPLPDFFIPAGEYADAGKQHGARVRIIPIERVVGALYYSYKDGHAIAGAIDGTVVDTNDIPTLRRPKDAWLPPTGSLSWEGLLAFAHERVMGVSEDVCDGVVAPDPSHKDVCIYCPVLACERRG